ncbi:MAG: hypothetical protein ACLGIA_14400 [Actinomycetes bacterium]
MPLTVDVATSEQEVDDARRLEEAVFGEVFGNTPEQLAAEYGPYEHASQFLLCRNASSGSALGVGRLIRPSDAGLKTLVDVAAEPWRADGSLLAQRAGLDLERTWDVATLAVLPSARRGVVSATLYRALVDAMQKAGAVSWTAIVDCKVLTLLRRAGISAEPLPGLEPAPYLGSVSSVPVFGHFADIRFSPLAPAPAGQPSRAA